MTSSFPSDRSSSVSVFLRFRTAGASSPSTGRFLQDRRRVPGRLSGPRRFGTASYSHWLERRAQLSHPGLVESQRIFLARLERAILEREHETDLLAYVPLSARYNTVCAATSRGSRLCAVSGGFGCLLCHLDGS